MGRGLLLLLLLLILVRVVSPSTRDMFIPKLGEKSSVRHPGRIRYSTTTTLDEVVVSARAPSVRLRLGETAQRGIES